MSLKIIQYACTYIYFNFCLFFYIEFGPDKKVYIRKYCFYQVVFLCGL